jgi:GDP-L-fucose synthase
VEKNAKIYVAGHAGLVGSALMRTLISAGYTNLITRTHAELELTNQAAVEAFFAAEKPDYVFLAAAKVGGIHANQTYPAEFIYSNLAINVNVLHAAWKNNVTRLLYLGSSCVYPKHAPQPMKEEYLLSGALEPTNRPYALAKIAGIELCASYNRQYGTSNLAVMPTNLYGMGDTYHLENSHVIPALLRKFYDAARENKPEVTIWGTGNAHREFLYSDDMAEACVFLMNLADAPFDALLKREDMHHLPLINIGVGSDVTIRELAETIRTITGFKGTLTFDTSKPDGTPQKLLDVNRIAQLGWHAKTPLHEGLAHALADYKTRSDV